VPNNVVFVVNPAGFKSAFKSWEGSPVGSWMKKKNEEVRLLAVAGAPGPGKPPRNTTECKTASKSGLTPNSTGTSGKKAAPSGTSSGPASDFATKHLIIGFATLREIA